MIYWNADCHKILPANVLMVVALLGLLPQAIMAATITTTDTDPDASANGFCSLIEAIDNANDDAQAHADCVAGNGADTIVLAGSNTYNLTDINNSTSGPGSNGLPVITSEIIIEGNGSTIQRSAAAGTPIFRIISVAESGNLTLNDLTIRNGRTGIPPLFTGGSSAIVGGGVFNAGSLTVRNSTITQNSGETYNGGGIGSTSMLTIENSHITNNHAGDDGGGIAASGTLLLLDSKVTCNTATDEAAGGILVWGTATVRNSTISHNEAFVGGGFHNLGNLSVFNSTISYNKAGADTQPTTGGGGIFNTGSTVRLVNSTVSHNSSTGTSGGGILNFTSPHNPRTVSITNSTLSHNSASFGGGIFNASGTTLHLENTIIANSDNGDCVNEGTLASSQANLIEDGSCSSALSGDPALGELADNGGPTETHALMPASAAVDAGNAMLCASLPIANLDQRGESRPVDGDGDGDAICDIGTYEQQETTPTCEGHLATIYVDSDTGRVMGGPLNGTAYTGVLLGTTGDDVMLATAAADRVIGGAGDDTICAAAGNDTLIGASGNDTLVGGDGDDRLIGGAGQDQIFGGGGRDTLIGGGADDFLNGGTAADRFIGGGGIDTVEDFNVPEGDSAVSVEVL